MTHSLISAAVLLTSLEPHLVISEERSLAQDGFVWAVPHKQAYRQRPHGKWSLVAVAQAGDRRPGPSPSLTLGSCVIK